MVTVKTFLESSPADQLKQMREYGARIRVDHHNDSQGTVVVEFDDGGDKVLEEAMANAMVHQMEALGVTVTGYREEEEDGSTPHHSRQ